MKAGAAMLETTMIAQLIAFGMFIISGMLIIFTDDQSFWFKLAIGLGVIALIVSVGAHLNMHFSSLQSG